MKPALIVLLIACMAALMLFAHRQHTPPPTASAEASARASPGQNNAAVELQQKAIPVPQPAETNLIEQLCLPDTYQSGPDGNEIGLKHIARSVEEFEAGLVGVKQKLTVSNDPEHLLTAAFLSDSPDERLALVSRALRTMPNDANLLRRAVSFCREAGTASPCPLTQWEARLLEADSQNSEAWMLVATNRYDRGDHRGALDALRQAASAGDTRKYWPETLQLIVRSLDAASDLPARNRLIDAMGIGAATSPDDRSLTMCASASGSDEWLDACLRYGQLAESQGKLFLTRAFGLAIQRLALETSGDTEGQSAVDSRIQALRAQSVGQADRDSARMLVLQADRVVQQIFLAKFIQAGEAAANQFLNDELESRLQSGDRVDCTGL